MTTLHNHTNCLLQGGPLCAISCIVCHKVTMSPLHKEYVQVKQRTMRPPPTAPPDMCSRVPTNTEPCW
jgi:hypothetical protein